MVNEKYAGTKNLTPNISTKRIRELFEKYKMNDKDESYLEESLTTLEQLVPEIEEKARWWDVIEPKLTAKQALHVLKNKNGK